ncbi:MAG: prepilin-type N-terminal cleavage/methylation domain-containing protein [Planctomycetes bacterium]|nr:prepilin-type N-terminal cleavage/methylation domain-containing protein [Planctomycetota bacterium]
MIRRTRRQGFTLIEITIALLITAIIMTSLGMILKSTVTAKISVESEARARRLGPAIMAIISRDLRNTWATGPDDNVEMDGKWMLGEHNGGDDDAQDELWFVTSIDSYLRYNGISSDLTEVGYYVKENKVDDGSPLDGLYSLYRREDFSVDKRPDEGGLGLLLHDRVVSFRVWYYDLPRDAVTEEGKIDPAALEEIVRRGSSSELDRWDTDDEERLPYAIRIELIMDATPIDAYNRRTHKRYAVYESLVRMPDFPKLDENFRLFTAQSPQPAAETPAEGENNGNNGNNGGNGTGGNGTGG